MDDQKNITENERNIENILSSLNEPQLRELYRKTGEKLRLLDNVKDAQALAQFNRGDRVIFKHNDRYISAVVTKLNRRTISIHTQDHEDWNVIPSHLSKLIEQN